jgi:hypothetical protein
MREIDGTREHTFLYILSGSAQQREKLGNADVKITAIFSPTVSSQFGANDWKAVTLGRFKRQRVTDIGDQPFDVGVVHLLTLVSTSRGSKSAKRATRDPCHLLHLRTASSCNVVLRLKSIHIFPEARNASGTI